MLLYEHLMYFVFKHIDQLRKSYFQEKKKKTPCSPKIYKARIFNSLIDIEITKTKKFWNNTDKFNHNDGV